MHRLRKKALAFTAIAACTLLYTTSCQKYEKPTAQAQFDYALQVIPDIHRHAKDATDQQGQPHDATKLLNIMDAIPLDTIINGQNTTIYKISFKEDNLLLE